MSDADFAAGYVARIVDEELDELVPALGGILLDGAKGVGKTATARQRAATVRALDHEGDRVLLAADVELIRRDVGPVLIDEWHRVPPVWNAVRRAIDDRGSGPYLLTGSPPGAGMHSGAGRIVSVRMRPLALSERWQAPPTVSLRRLLDGERGLEGHTSFGLVGYVDEIVRGGLPGTRHLRGRALRVALDGYVDRIVERDLPELGFTVRRPTTLRAWLRAYAAATATTASWERIRDAATAGEADKPAKTTTITYTDLLTALRVFDPLEAWLPGMNHFSRLASAPKHHLVDPALAARLLGRTPDDLLAGRDGPVVIPRDGVLLGALFESLVTLSVRTMAQSAEARVSHLRTDGGRHEVDLIVERNGRVLAIEVKLGAVVSDSDVRHLVWLRELLGDDLIDAIVITTGSDVYRRPDGIGVVPLALLGA